ncbi:MAG: SEC-C domain-containing protein [Kangiellaceae bacterium]|nr:SEC-C domain-containing protein [Kangiellaceae bacterium]
MSRFFYDGNANRNNDSGSGSLSKDKVVRLGTKKAPAKMIVASEDRKQELDKILLENKWIGEVTVDDSVEEDVRDLDILQHKTQQAVSTKKASRNDPCPCDSGKKYKKCCGA